MSRNIKLIFLTGFMGAGKTTVGKVLADKLQCGFVDLDAVVIEREQKSIAEIFTENGEKYFRDCESEALNSLAVDRSAVVATGGGVVIRKENRDRMKEIGRLIYLKASWNVLKNRLESSTERPLVDQKNGWDNVETLWLDRQTCYEDCDLVVRTDDLQPEEIAQSIMKQLAGQ